MQTACPEFCLSGADLGSEDRLPGLRDHVELLDGGGQVTRGSEVSQTHEAALGPNVIVGPVVPFVRSVRGWRKHNPGVLRAQMSQLQKRCGATISSLLSVYSLIIINGLD